MEAINTYSLPWWINNQYNSIKTIVKSKANKFRLEFDELLSEVNLRLSSTNCFQDCDHVNKFFAWIHRIVQNCAIDLYRRLRKDKCLVNIDEISEILEYNATHCTKPLDLSMKDFANRVVSVLRDKFSARDCTTMLDVFELYFIDGLKYEEVSERLDLNLNTVKANIGRIRALSNKILGKQYKSVVQS